MKHSSQNSTDALKSNGITSLDGVSAFIHNNRTISHIRNWFRHFGKWYSYQHPENGMEWNNPGNWECTTCHAYSVCACKICVWRSMSSLYHSLQRHFIPPQSFFVPIPFHFDSQHSELSCIQSSAQCTLYIENVEKHPLECIRIDEQELKFLCIFHFKFSSILYHPPLSFSILQKSLYSVFVFRAFCISKIIFFVLFHSFILRISSLSSHIAHHIRSQFLFPFRITFVIPLLSFTENHDMIAQYAISIQDKPCVRILDGRCELVSFISVKCKCSRWVLHLSPGNMPVNTHRSLQTIC